MLQFEHGIWELSHYDTPSPGGLWGWCISGNMRRWQQCVVVIPCNMLNNHSIGVHVDYISVRSWHIRIVFFSHSEKSSKTERNAQLHQIVNHLYLESKTCGFVFTCFKQMISWAEAQFWPKAPPPFAFCWRRGEGIRPLPPPTYTFTLLLVCLYAYVYGSFKQKSDVSSRWFPLQNAMSDPITRMFKHTETIYILNKRLVMCI